MHLHRVTPDPFQHYKYEPGGHFLGMPSTEFKATTFQIDGEEVVQAVVTCFRRFGGGRVRQSDFEVYVDWQDLEKIIEKFCDADHPQALALQEARKLADALKSFICASETPGLAQSNDRAAKDRDPELSIKSMSSPDELAKAKL